MKAVVLLPVFPCLFLSLSLICTDEAKDKYCEKSLLLVCDII